MQILTELPRERAILRTLAHTCVRSRGMNEKSVVRCAHIRTHLSALRGIDTLAGQTVSRVASSPTRTA